MIYFPYILKEGQYTHKELAAIKKKSLRIVDIYDDQLREFFGVMHPELTEINKFRRHFNKYKLSQKKDNHPVGNWVFFPWRRICLHTLTANKNLILRTNRNKNLISAQEQKKLNNFKIGIAGLSVGSNIAMAIARNGIGRNFKLADYDTLSTSNLNRTPYGLLQVGQKKINVLMQKLFELDPFFNISTFDKGLQLSNIKKFITEDPKPSLIFEIIDDLKMKLFIRRVAKQNRVPVIMLTSVHDKILIDVERYDISENIMPFNGHVAQKILSKIERSKNNNLVNQIAVEIVNKKNITPRLMSSLNLINHTLSGRPQLMSSIDVAAGAAAFAARKIALGQKLKSGRSIIDLNTLIK